MTTYSGSVSPSNTWSYTQQPIAVNYSDSLTISVGGTNVEGLEFVDFYVTAAWLSAHNPINQNDLSNEAIYDVEGNGSPPETISSHTVATISAANGGGNPPGFLDANGHYVTSGSGYLILAVYGYGNLYPITQNFTITTQSGGTSPPPPTTPGTYIGPNPGDFGNGANWPGGVVPGSSTNVTIGNGVTVNSAGTYEVSSLGLNTNTTFNVNSGGFVADNYINNQGTINVSGSLQANPFNSGAYITNFGTIIITVPAASLTAPTATNLGTMQAHGGLIDFDPLTVSSGTVEADSGGRVVVTGTTTLSGGTMQANSVGSLVLGAVTGNAGIIYANAGGMVYLSASASGTWSFVVNGGGLVLGGADSVTVNLASGQLTIDQPAAFTGTIVFSGSPANDVIDLPGITVTRVYNTGTSLLLTESNGATVGLPIQNLGYNYVTPVADGSGGTALVFRPGVPTDMILRSSSSGVLEAFDLGDNTILAAASLGQVGSSWQVAGYGDFSGTPGEVDMLMRNSNGAFEYYDLSNNRITAAGSMGQVGTEWSIAGFGDFSGNANETDMLMRNSRTGALEIFDIHGNSIVGAATMGQVGSEWQISGFGDFSGNANETDMMMRNSNTGAFEIYDIRGNSIVAQAAMGQAGMEWQIAGFGDFSGNANETDMLLRNRNTGAFEIYDIRGNSVVAAASMGQVGSEWQVVGFGALGLNAGESDMLMRSNKTGAFELYDISNNAIVSGTSMGQVGLDWQSTGLAADPPSGASGAAAAQLAQAMAAFAAAGSPVDTASLSDPATQTAAASPVAASLGQLHQT